MPSPVRALRFCSAVGCSARVVRGRCPAHAQARNRERPNLEIQKLYRTARWRARREQARNENPLCVDCQAEGRVVLWDDLDHDEPHENDLTKFWTGRLVGRCKRHHLAKTLRGL